MGNLTADPRNQLVQPTNPMGSLGTAYGSPVSQDGSYRRSDGSVDWIVGYGPGYNWGGEDQRTGQTPIGMAPEPDSVAPRGTPQWRQAQAAREQWIESNRAQGRTLADLGLEPTRGGGLSNYMRYANTPRGTASLGGGVREMPTGPTGIQNPAQMQPGGNMTPTGIVRQAFGGLGQRQAPTNQGGMNQNPFGSLNFPIMGSPIVGGLNQPQGAQKRQKPMKSMGGGMNPTAQLGAVPINNGRVTY